MALSDSSTGLSDLYPAFRFGILKADYRGAISLPKGVKSYTSATYYFSGQSEEVSKQQRRGTAVAPRPS